MAPITGTYTQTSCEKYEDFLKALGVGFILRKAALASTPVMTISEEGGNWTMVTKTTVKSIELKFRSVKITESDKKYEIFVELSYIWKGNIWMTYRTQFLTRLCKNITSWYRHIRIKD